ncbi:MAG: phytanoyl-CoA dioxygenase family protein [Alphaproteobacteria bacterium]
MGKSRPIVSESDIADYEENGVVCLRGVLDRPWIEALRDELERVFAHPGPQGKDYDNQGSGRFRYDTFMWMRHEKFWRLQAESPIAEVTATLMRSSKSYLMADIVFAKEANTPNVTPWHQDQPYGWYDGNQVCSGWMPLDRVDLANGAVEYVAGTHRWGKWYRPVEFGSGQDQATAKFETIPDINAERSKHEIIHFDCEPGDLLIHHSLVIHGSPGNSTSDRRRRAISLRYAGDDATYAVREVGPKPVRDPGLSPGDHFGCDLFPRVWPPAPLPRFWERRAEG